MYGKEPYLQLERNVLEGTVFTTGKECTGRNRIYYWKGMYWKEPYTTKLKGNTGMYHKLSLFSYTPNPQHEPSEPNTNIFYMEVTERGGGGGIHWNFLFKHNLMIIKQFLLAWFKSFHEVY